MHTETAVCDQLGDERKVVSSAILPIRIAPVSICSPHPLCHPE
ncbi:MAG: hypothetical protein R3C62_25665 [Chloroflexota bacterium]